MPKPEVFASYPKWVTSPSVGPVVVANEKQEAAVLADKAEFSVTVLVGEDGQRREYQFVGRKD